MDRWELSKTQEEKKRLQFMAALLTMVWLLSLYSTAERAVSAHYWRSRHDRLEQRYERLRDVHEAFRDGVNSR